MAELEIDYLHNFASWAARRSIQNPSIRNTSTKKLNDAIKKANLISFLLDKQTLNIKNLQIIQDKKTNKIKIYLDISYGAAAKLVAVYLKTAIVIPNLYNLKMRRIIESIYPPIDSKNLKKILGKSTFRWTKLSKKEHENVISKLDGKCKEKKISYLQFESENEITK